jgi:hypothetical protein
MSLPHSSRKSIEAMYQREELARANPDSPYWMHESKASQATLEKLLGDDGYEAWAELVWPGDSIDGKTWKEINQATSRAIEEAWQGQRDLNRLADAAKYPDNGNPYGLQGAM